MTTFEAKYFVHSISRHRTVTFEAEDADQALSWAKRNEVKDKEYLATLSAQIVLWSECNNGWSCKLVEIASMAGLR